MVRQHWSDELAVCGRSRQALIAYYGAQKQPEAAKRWLARFQPSLGRFRKAYGSAILLPRGSL